MNDEEFLRLTTLYLEDAIDTGGLELLNRELASSPDRVRQFNDLRLVTGLIHEHGRAVESGDVAASGTNSPSETPSIVSTVVGSRRGTALKFQSSQRAIAATVAVLAAAASLLLFLNWPDTESPRGGSAPAIATLGYTSHAKWGSEERVMGDRLIKGKMHLEIGLARLDFRNGATVTLQGPAVFEILSTDKTILTSGILTASIPESAVGFKVLTPAMDVVDLGTAFGVSVGGDGETDVCVFEGEVEVCLAEGKDTPHLVREGSAVRSRPRADSIDTVGYSTERYENAWPVTSGVLQATGLVKFVAPGPNFVPGRFEDSERILVFYESSQVLLR